MRYVAGIVLDMVGGRNLQIKQEPNSLNAAPELVREVWGVRESPGSQVVRRQTVARSGTTTSPLNRAGIPTIDHHRLRLSVLAQSR